MFMNQMSCSRVMFTDMGEKFDPNSSEVQQLVDYGKRLNVQQLVIAKVIITKLVCILQMIITGWWSLAHHNWGSTTKVGLVWWGEKCIPPVANKPRDPFAGEGSRSDKESGCKHHVMDEATRQ